MKAWLLSFRIKTLTAAVVPILVGSALAWAESGRFSLWFFSLCLLASLFIQIATNLFNDAIDFKKGADTKDRVGPLRVTQSQLISPRKVMILASFFLALALLCGIPIVGAGGWPFVVIGVSSLFLAYGYTGGPFPLAYLGLGDVFVILYFGLIAVGGVYYLHAGMIQESALVAGLQVGLLATVLLAINNLRDVVQDQKANKKTLAVRFGKGFAKAEILMLYVLTYLLNVYWIYRGFVAPAVLSLFSLPLAYRVVQFAYSEQEGKIYNNYLAKASASHVVFGLFFALGMVFL